MSDAPYLLFLHGVGDGNIEDGWRAVLAEALGRLGYPSLERVEVIAPRYAHALKGDDFQHEVPDYTIKKPAREAARANRREFERRMGAIEFRLGRHDGGNTIVGTDSLIGAAVATPPFQQARNYLTKSEIRAQVLLRILDALPRNGRIVIVGHSLGSVVAADLVRRLPVGLEVVGMVTIGSPLAHSSFDVEGMRSAMSEPPRNLLWWVNFWNAPDLVAAHRGVSSVFPWMVDFRIDNKTMLLPAHAAVGYLSNEAVAAAIGYALFGSLTKELVPVEAALDTVMDPAERMAIIALRYAHLTLSKLKGDQRNRFAGALRHVQASVIDEIVARASGESRGLPSAVAHLRFDLSDPEAIMPEPRPSQHLFSDQAVVLLTVLAGENVVRPFEIELPRALMQESMEDLSAEMGLTSGFGADVFDASKEARRALTGGFKVNWARFGALGAGAAAIVVATGGLALAAGAGLAGAAVITSALATFGPGGMLGGLLTAGTLLTAGGGGIAFGLAGSTTSAETLEAVVERRLAVEILRKKRGLDSDPTTWKVLVDIEREVRREHERLDELSDESAPTLQDLKRKIAAVERALAYLREHGLEPLPDNADTTGP